MAIVPCWEGLTLGRSKNGPAVLGVWSVLVILYTLLACGRAAGSQVEQEPLIFLVNANIVPIAYEENGIAKGVVVDIAKALGEKLDRPIEVIAMEWPEAQAKVLSGEADALLQVNRTPAREASFSFSVPLLRSEFVIIRRLEDFDIHRESDLEGKRVGVEMGGYAHDLIGKNDGIEMVLVLKALEGLELLRSKHVDAFVVDRWVGEYALAQNRISRLHIAREPLETSYSHIAVRKGDDQLLEQINYGLQEINSDGTLAEILDSWRGKNVIYITEESVIRIALLTVIAMLLVISSIAIFFVVKLKKLNKTLESKVSDRTQELAMVNERLQMANAELKKQSIMDQLTQIPNRRGFETFFKAAWEESLQAQTPLALIIVDIDNFKAINDSLGHLMGDRCLKEMAVILRNVAQHIDLQVARLAGDEFACVLLNATEAQAVQVAAEIRKKMEELVITNEGMQTRMSASFGVASLTPILDTLPRKLFSLADQALYKAKGMGRNAVVGANSLPRKTHPRECRSQP